MQFVATSKQGWFNLLWWFLCCYWTTVSSLTADVWLDVFTKPNQPICSLCFSSPHPFSHLPPLIRLHFYFHFPLIGPSLSSTNLLLLLSRIQPPAPDPRPLTGVPWVSSSNRCSPACSPACSSGCVVSPTHGPESLWSSDTNRGMKGWNSLELPR